MPGRRCRPEKSGYIRNDLLVYGEEAKGLYQEVHGISGTVEASSLRLREEPSLESPQVGAVPQGTKVRLLGRDGEWFQVRIDDADAYMFAEYITEDELEATAVTEEEYLKKQQEEAAREEEEKAARQFPAQYLFRERSGSAGCHHRVRGRRREPYGQSGSGGCDHEPDPGQPVPGQHFEVVYQSGQFSPVASSTLPECCPRGQGKTAMLRREKLSAVPIRWEIHCTLTVEEEKASRLATNTFINQFSALPGESGAVQACLHKGTDSAGEGGRNAP